MSIVPVPELPGASANVSTFSFGGYATEPLMPLGVPFWPRAGARLIDYVLHYCVGYAAAALFSIFVLASSSGHMPMWVLARFRHPGLIGILSGATGFLVYNVACLSLHGSTLGKRLLSVVVVQEDGTRCRMWPAVIRELGYFIDSLFFGLVAYFAMQKDVMEQRYGDQWAGTFVCKRSIVIPEQLQPDSRFILALMLAVFADAGMRMIGLLILIRM
ncbi:MAG TPA: RDD family protein [Candidatus Deferrimicrobiaceae bacterium]|nr:RDD family protein [Candidatus Deferrimicrobiaceae bacterium]